jgi:Mn2+/Fe2+ NRAMP family transporter
MAPSFAVGAVGIDATQALILSQVALSLILPVPMIALLILTRRREVMGSFASGFLTMAAATAAAAIVLAAAPRLYKILPGFTCRVALSVVDFSRNALVRQLPGGEPCWFEYSVV